MPFTNHCCPRVLVSHVSMAPNYLICVLEVMLHGSDHKLWHFLCVIVSLLNLSVPGPKNPAAVLLWLFRFLFANCNLASLFLAFLHLVVNPPCVPSQSSLLLPNVDNCMSVSLKLQCTLMSLFLFNRMLSFLDKIHIFKLIAQV